MYNTRLAAQMVAFFAMKEPLKKINILKLMKLFYLANRESIKRYGYPIIDDRHVSMKDGPVCLTTYKHCDNINNTDSDWSNFISTREGYDIPLSNQKLSVDDLDEFSEADIECMEHIWQKFGHMPKYKLRNWTHVKENVPEYTEISSGIQDIPLDEIMRGVGLDNVNERYEEWLSMQSSLQSLSTPQH